jgi:hypothetical protein
MRFAKLAAIGAIAIVAIGCSSSATPTPPAGGSSPAATVPTSAPASVPASAPASNAPSAPASAAATDTGGAGGSTAPSATGLDTTPAAKMCGLLTTDEAQTLLGKSLSTPPFGDVTPNLGTDCIWQTDATMNDGTYIEVSIVVQSYDTGAGILDLMGPTSKFTVAGLQATGVDNGQGTATQGEAAIQLSAGPNDPSMLISGPTLDIVKSVATKVLARLDTLK